VSQRHLRVQRTRRRLSADHAKAEFICRLAADEALAACRTAFAGIAEDGYSPQI
jgi:hypothetical protein